MKCQMIGYSYGCCETASGNRLRLRNFNTPNLTGAMFRVTREIDFCYGHRLLNYEGKCRYLHGHNGRAVISIEGEKLDNRGMIVDFADIKRTVSTWIDENLDHRMLLHREDPVVPILQDMGEPLWLLDENPTAENIAKLIYTESNSLGVPIVEVRLWETPRCYATYAEPGSQ